MAAPVTSAASTYWAKSRTPRYSLLFALPLVLLYEALAAAPGNSDAEGAGLRNAADVLLRLPFTMFSGSRGSLAFFGTVVAIFIFFIARDLTRTRDSLRPSVFLVMLGESAVLALLLGVVVGAMTSQLIEGLSLALQAGAPTPIEAMSRRTQLMLSLGAGLYEELLFRVLLVGGLAYLLRRVTSMRKLFAGIVATVVGALIFSAVHYIGAYGDPFEIQSFTYRAIAGVVFSALYLTRGFGITAWTHALYDVYVMML